MDRSVLMITLYISEQGCYVSLKQESITIEQQDKILAEVQIPLIEQILIFGKSQLTTEVIRTCLDRDIPIAYLSRMGYCYGRMLPISRGYRQLVRYQQQLSNLELLLVAQQREHPTFLARLIALTLNPSPSGRGTSNLAPFSLREKGWG